ncbi:MAG: hypothetical protein C0483_26220 [Pirellula sp.]|nr:hypothetical protein [Pirellula sp.]
MILNKEVPLTEKRRGRPPTYSDDDRKNFATLIRLHGARGAREAAPLRSSMDTLLKIAQAFGIQLKAGKRPKHAA